MKTYFNGEKREILEKTWLSKPSCHGNINIEAYVATTSRCSQIIFGKSRKLGKYGGHSLNGFEVTQLLREGGGGGLEKPIWSEKG